MDTSAVSVCHGTLSPTRRVETITNREQVHGYDQVKTQPCLGLLMPKCLVEQYVPRGTNFLRVLTFAFFFFTIRKNITHEKIFPQKIFSAEFTPLSKLYDCKHRLLHVM